MADKSITTISDWLTGATQRLKNAGIPSPRLDAELLMAHTLRKSRTWLHAHSDEKLSDRHIEIANARTDLRLDRVPVAYIIGHKEFYGHTFKVTTATLIPRPESEVLIDLLTESLPRDRPLLSEERLKLVDVGTGSGCLGITASLMHPELQVTLVDTSRHALAIAEDNSESLGADIDTLQSDLLAQYPFVADIIMANLPYVDPNWERSPETEHEPALALFADDEGVSLIFELIQQTKEKLHDGGLLILEADPVQHEAIKKEAAAHGLILQAQRDYGIVFNKVA